MNISDAIIFLSEVKKSATLFWCFFKEGVMSKWKTI